MSHQYSFRRGDRVRIISGKHAGATGTVDSKVESGCSLLTRQRRVSHPIYAGSTLRVEVGPRATGPYGRQLFYIYNAGFSIDAALIPRKTGGGMD